MPSHPDLVAKAIGPEYVHSPHVAPLALALSAGNELADAYRNGAFKEEHGRGSRHRMNGYKVVFMALVAGRPSRTPRELY
jgi:glucose/arabinose dehydrogenase